MCRQVDVTSKMVALIGGSFIPCSGKSDNIVGSHEERIAVQCIVEVKVKFAASLTVGVVSSLFVSSLAFAAETTDKASSSEQLFSSSLRNSSTRATEYSTLAPTKQAAARGDSDGWNTVWKLMDKNDYSEAISLLSDLIAKNDRADEAYCLRAKCWLLLNKLDRAISDAQKSISVNKHFAPPWVIIGLCQMQANDGASAIATFTEALKIDRTNVSALTRRGFCYIAMGKPHEGIADENAAINEDDSCFNAYYFRQKGYVALKNWLAVKADGEKMIQLDRNAPEGHLSRAHGLLNLNRGYEAVAEFQKSIPSYRYYGDTDQVNRILDVLAELIPKYDYGRSRTKMTGRDVENAKFAAPTNLKCEGFTMETLPPQMRSKPGSQKGDTKARWLIGKTWPPGSKITVAFNGGTPQLQKLVANTAPEWSKYGNIRFDFGFNPSTGKYRQWSKNDTSANIRIAFNENDGHWSNIGMESKNVFPEDPRSMNLSLNSERPERQKTVILHEFGHALGFGHEHQHPDGGCDDEIRWEDEPGYQVTWRLVGDRPDLIAYVNDATGKRPGVYSQLVGGFNQWTPREVDSQLREFSRQSAFDMGFNLGPVDRKSIMHYSFDPKFFKYGKDSPCCIAEASEISELDKKGIAKFYPPGSAKPYK